ncbi:Lrp/AsnC family transcriptional regulator [Robertkochia flava]|uniref:Lrp/AsnC family transcriptional regulator n=1 Tax=Robertkochia flava TaxID=3447986 RepID=UPI00293D82F6|nr:winged helix-turn-helix transcriptional regulator [Robertkochia marina]
MDSTDRKILMELQHSRQNTKEIASKIGLSVTPTYERIKKLEQQGIIRGYVALLDRESTGLNGDTLYIVFFDFRSQCGSGYL